MRLQTGFGRIEVTAIVTDTDAVLAYWKQHWPADRDERARRERDNLHQFVDLVKPEPARLRQANVLMVGLRGATQSVRASSKVTSDGSFEIQNVRPGSYTVYAFATCANCDYSLEVPSRSLQVVVGNTDVTGLSLNIP